MFQTGGEGDAQGCVLLDFSKLDAEELVREGFKEGFEKGFEEKMTEEGEAVVFLDSDDEKDKSGEDGKGEEDEVKLEMNPNQC